MSELALCCVVFGCGVDEVGNFENWGDFKRFD